MDHVLRGAVASALVDETKLMDFLERIVDEVGAALNVALTVIGERRGLYRAMADGTPVTPAALAARTGTQERYVRDWLAAQAAGGYVTYDAQERTYALPAEHAAVLVDEDSPVHQGGLLQAASAAMRAQDGIGDRFDGGGDVGWHEHHDDPSRAARG